MQIIKVIEFVSILTILAYILFVSSSDYAIEKIPLWKTKWIPYQQHFYKTKVETVYQCMELCSQYPICKSLWELRGNCRLYKVTLEKTFSVSTDGQYYDASWIPKSILGVCANHSCSKDQKCVRHHLDSYVCVPHIFPTFTCEEKWLYSTRKCYFVYTNFKAQVSWQEAKNYCTKLKSSLIDIESPEEQAFLNLIFRFITFHYIVPNATTIYWTSLQYISQKANWIWNDSGRIQHDSSFSYWFPNYTQLIKPDQDNCMAVSNDTDYHWSAENCSANGVFLCERLMV